MFVASIPSAVERTFMKFRVLLMLGGMWCAASVNAPVLAAGPAARASFAHQSAPATDRVSASSCLSHAYDTGQTLLRARQYRQARNEFQTAIRCHDHVTQAYANLGTANFDLGQYAAAYAAYRTAALRSPHDPSLTYITGFAALYAGKWKDAVAYATATLKLQPKSDATYHLRFLAYGRLLLSKQQVKDASAEVKLKPYNADYWDDVGIALYNNSKLADSIGAFTHAIQLQPSHWNYYKNRAISEVASKQSKVALKDLEKAYSLASAPSDKKQLSIVIAKLKKNLHQ